MAPTLIYGK